MEISDVGSTIASAVAATVGTGGNSLNGVTLSRGLALGHGKLTREKVKLTGISKHGNRYHRRLHIHGAPSVLQFVRD